MEFGWTPTKERSHAVAWDPRVSVILGDWFQSSIGTGLLRVVAGAFQRFGLELDYSPGASWFYDGDGSTVSELKWKIWTVAIAHVLRVPIPEVFLHLFIAADYFTRQRGRSNQQRCGDRTVLSLAFPCYYAVRKLEKLTWLQLKVHSPDTEAMASPERISYLVSLLSRVPCTLSTRACLLDAMRLFDVTKPLTVLFFGWLQLQIQTKKQPLEWLDAFEAQAKAGVGGHLGNLLLFFPYGLKGLVLPSTRGIERIYNVWFKELMVEWESIDLTPGVRQVLEEVVTHKSVAWDESIRVSLERWVRRCSLVYRYRPREVSYFMDFTDASLQIGRLLYTWTLTRKGKRDHAELQTLCSTSKSIVEYARSVTAGSSEDRELYRAAAAVFGKEFSGHFAQLCKNAQWQDGAVPCSQSELGEIRELAWSGQFLIFNFQYIVPEHYFDGGAKQLRNNVPLGAMIVYIVHLIFEDHLALDIDRKTWTQECKMALNSHPNLAISKNQGGIFIPSDATRKTCLIVKKWVESPRLQRAVRASAGEIDDAMVKAIAAGGTYYDEERKDVWARICRVFKMSHARLSVHIIAYSVFKEII